MALCSWRAGAGAWGCGRDQPVARGVRGVGRSWVRIRVGQRVPLLLALRGCRTLALGAPDISMQGTPQPWLAQLKWRAGG